MAAAGPVLSPLELTRRRRAWAGWVRLGRLERAGLAVLALTTAVAVLAPLLAPYSPTTAVHAESFAPPGTHGLLVGSDELSRDLFSRVLYGIRASWLSALAVIASGVLIGGLIGTVAGIAGGWIDTTLMRVTALFLALPAAVLAIAVIAALGPSLPHTLVAVGIVWWPWYARIVRAEVRAQAVRAHVDAARLAGVGRGAPGAAASATRSVSGGAGHGQPRCREPRLDPGRAVVHRAWLATSGAELGAMAARGMPYLFGHPWIPLAPAIAVFLLAVAANLAGDGLRDLLEDH
jgi:peptide/nickel transport system permease protein